MPEPPARLDASDQYDEAEAQRRFEAALRAALTTAPKRQRDMARKDKGVPNPQREPSKQRASNKRG